MDAMYKAGEKVTCQVCFTEVFFKPTDIQMPECACGKGFAQLETDFVAFETKAKADEQEAVDKKNDKTNAKSTLDLPSSWPGKAYCMKAVYDSFVTVVNTADPESVKDDWDDSILGEDLEETVKMFDDYYKNIGTSGAKTAFLNEFRNASSKDIIKAVIATANKHGIKP